MFTEIDLKKYVVLQLYLEIMDMNIRFVNPPLNYTLTIKTISRVIVLVLKSVSNSWKSTESSIEFK